MFINLMIFCEEQKNPTEYYLANKKWKLPAHFELVFVLMITVFKGQFTP